MRKLLMAAVLIVAPGAVLAQEEALAEERDARLVEIKGDVTVYAAEATEGLAAETDFPLKEGDRVKTGPAGSAEIFLDGGSLLRLRENTDFIYKAGARQGTVFELAMGSLLAKIRKLAAGETLRIRTPTAVAAVRGTEFAVEVDPVKAEETHVGVFDEGKIEVSAPDGASELLNANQETKVSRGQRPLPAYQLHHFARHRSFMRQQMRRRATALDARWKRLPPAQRLELREKAFERMRQRRAAARERIERRPEKRDGRRDDLRKRNEEKMQKRKDEIRRRVRQQP